MSAQTEKTYVVQGMTCGHCELSVTEAVEELAGVERARADRRAGTVVVCGGGFSDEHVRSAVAEAGYEVSP